MIRNECPDMIIRLREVYRTINMAADYIADSVRSNEEIYVPIFTVSHVGFAMQTYLTHEGLTWTVSRYSVKIKACYFL